MNSDTGFDPYSGAASIDPYGGHGEEIPAGVPGAGMGSWRTWRTKGAWENWKTIPRTFPYLRPYRKYYALVILLGFVGALVAIAEPWPLAWMLDSVLGHKDPPGLLKSIVGSDPNVYHLLILIVLLGFGVTLIGQSIDVVSNYAGAKLEQNMILDLRSKLFRHCENLSLTFHDERMTGQLMSVINMQASAVGGIVMAFPPIFQNALTLFGMLVIALLIDWQVTLIALVAIPLVYYATGLYGTRIVPRIRQVMSLEWRSLSIVFEAMSMLRVIVSFGRENYEHRRFTDQGRTAVNARVALTVRETMFSLAVTTATALGTSLVLGFGAWHVLNGSISTGELIVLISYIAAVYQPLEQLGHEIGHMHSSLVFVNAAFNMLDEKPEVVEAPNPVDLGRARGEIELRNVSFAYASRVDTIKDITFKIAPGERVAIVGPTGAGKTTMINLIVRFYDPQDGQVLIDGHDVKHVSLASLRENISLVLQTPLLFSGTIAENIRYGRLDATRDEIIEAAKAANAHEFVTGLPDGYETVVGEGGSQLSGGERQRICVARAFVRNAPILILDEPTSSIDSKTEAVILDALDDLMENRTSFMIAHRLSTIHDADRILVVNHGELVEQGTHDELIALGGLYSQLYDAQTRQKRRRGHRGPSFDQLVAQTPPEEVRERVAAALVQPPAQPPVEAGNGAPPGGNGQPAVTSNGGEPQVPAQQRPAGNGAQPGGAKDEQPRSRVKIASKRREMHCDVCGRVLLRGEPVAAFLAPPAKRRGRKEIGLDGPDGMAPHLTDFRKMGKTDRKLACELCWIYAEEHGWSPLPGPGVPR
jgi:ATP-binding cassette subfamily B protein